MTEAETAAIFNSMFSRLKPAETQAQMFFNALHETLNDPEVVKFHAYTVAPVEFEEAA